VIAKKAKAVKKKPEPIVSHRFPVNPFRAKTGRGGKRNRAQRRRDAARSVKP
jgi:hypothetical protein